MISLLLQYKYFIIIPLGLVEGPIVMMVCGVLLKLGYFDFWSIYPTLVLIDFAADIIWYEIGFHFGNSFVKNYGKYFSITPHGVGVITKLFLKYQNSILIISKLTTGLGFAVGVIFTAGLVKVPFKRYAIINFLGGFVWTGFLLSIGYYLGDAYVHVNSILGKMAILAIIILIFFALFGLGKYLKNRTLNKYS